MLEPFIKNKLNKWFGKRMPISDSINLEQKSTYILPTGAGFLLLLIVLLMIIAATNYQNNLAFLLTFLIVSIGLVSIIISFKNLQGLNLNLVEAQSVFLEDKLTIKIQCKSQFEQNHFTIGLGVSNKKLCYFDIKKEQPFDLILTIDTTYRGWVKLPKLIASSRFPFGLFNIWSWFQFESLILVYPKAIKPPEMATQGNSDDENGSKKSIGGDELFGLKDYQAGDLVSRIDWKALAREKGLLTKEFVTLQSQDLAFDWHDYVNVNGELRLSYLCFLVVAASKKNVSFSLNLPTKYFAINHGEQHKQTCLLALATYDVGLAE